VSHTGDKPNHCTMCDMWFTHPKELKAHLKHIHSTEDNSAEELVLSASAIAIEGAETVLLDDGIQVEHVTVEPAEEMEMEEEEEEEEEEETTTTITTVLVEDGGVAEMCEEDVERLKQAGVQIQVVHVTTTEVDGRQVEVEVEMEGEVVSVEEAEQAVSV